MTDSLLFLSTRRGRGGAASRPLPILASLGLCFFDRNVASSCSNEVATLVLALMHVRVHVYGISSSWDRRRAVPLESLISS